MLCKLNDEFDARNLSVVILCADSGYTCCILSRCFIILSWLLLVVNIRKWIREIEEVQNCKVVVPILSDENKDTIAKYGCTKSLPPFYDVEIYSNGLFLIDIDKIIRLGMKYSVTVGKIL